jgi:NhaA family Na+:H+ antiporter
VRRLLRLALDHYLVVPLGLVVALIWVNTAPESYFKVAEGLSFAVNDVGMAFLLALLMQEVVEAILPGGTLHPWRRGMLPIIAAAGGTLGAIATYRAAISLGNEPVLAIGWPVATAVDVAAGFLVARSIFGRHAAVTFLLLLSTASDAIGLVLISQRYPVGRVYPGALALVAVAIAVAIVLRWSGVRRVPPYVLIGGTLSWFGCFWSGVHPALALLPIVPFLSHTARDLNQGIGYVRRRHETPTHFEHAFRYPVQLVAFLFGLVNGGVLIRGFGSGTWALLAAALVGRPAGIVVAVGLALAAGLQFPRRLGWREMIVVALAASSGFTFALFFAAAVVPIGPSLLETRTGALATAAGTLLALAAARLLRVGRFAA